MLAKKDKVLYTAVIILALLYGLSFIKAASSSDKRESINSSLVNPKYKSSINQIDLYNINNSICLKKINNKSFNYWVIMDEEGHYISPADSQKVEKMLSELTKVRSMYKLSDKIDINSAFGLTDSSAFHIKYYYQDAFHDLTFGNQNFSLSDRYIMTDANTRVYEINSDLDPYLSTSPQAWSEAFIISQEVLGKLTAKDIQSCKTLYQNKYSKIDDIQKLLDLRKGGIPAQKPDLTSESPDFEISLEIGNKSQIQLKIFKTKDQAQFLIKVTYINPDKSSLDYFANISLWTYNKIKEITL
ncbi:MAG: DUF4340 domain-containing protein [Treponema sp.]|nr:DUF4340 domain-containing protein [Treponema sp.]